MALNIWDPEKVNRQNAKSDDENNTVSFFGNFACFCLLCKV